MNDWRIALPMYGITERARQAQGAWLSQFSVYLHASGWTGAITAVSAPTPLHDHWLDPNLLLSQTCGYPLMTRLRDQVTLLASPRYVCEGCVGEYYSSRLVVREVDASLSLGAFKGAIAAINSEDSNSGMNVLRHAIAPWAENGGFFAKIQVSGSHLASLASVRDGYADIAAIDAVTWALLEESEPKHLKGLKTLAFSAQSPSLPLIGSRSLTEGQRRLIWGALTRLETNDTALLGALRIDGYSAPDWRRYDRILDLEIDARRVGVIAL